MNIIYIFLLIGQSNMVGMATIPPNLPPVTQQVMLFGNDDVWKVYSDPYDGYIGQVDMVSADLPPYQGAYGPARSLVTTFTELNHGKKIAIVPGAKGASSVFDWQRNLSPTTLYGSAVRRVNLALQKPKTKLAGIIYYQGEQEAAYANTSTLWAQNFTQMVADFRSDFNSPNLPVIFTKLPTRSVPHPWYPYWNEVRANQMTVSIPNVYRADFEDIDMIMNPQDLYGSAHLTAEQYDVVGTRWAQIITNNII